MKQAVVLFAHGARDPAWAGPVRRLAATIAETAPDLVVEVAFLELMEPRLDEAIDRLVERGVRQVRVVPVFLAEGGHLKRDVPVLIDAARDRHPGCELVLVRAVGEDESVIRAMAAYALAGSGG
ncbi:MAG: CbiX/SirB N-terminal domain-containing protein [Rhodocyclaceae bacterium]|nr:CbiX/SirB N-terminal domain-containing protein [Rhodocyclaceae bacterium]